SVKASGSGQPRPTRRARRIHSPAAVGLTPRLAAILRLDMPPALSRSTSWILRMGNLCPGIPSSSRKEPSQCRFEDHPTVLITPVHSLVAIARNGWSRSIGTTGHNQSEQVVAITRCAQSPFGAWHRSTQMPCAPLNLHQRVMHCLDQCLTVLPELGTDRQRERCVLTTRIGAVTGLGRPGSGGLAANPGKYPPAPRSTLLRAAKTAIVPPETGVHPRNVY